MEHDNEIIGTAQLCVRAGVSRETLRAWRAKGMPFIQVSPHILRYRWSACVAWMESATAAPASA